MISVCIATYNGEKYIRQQLESILSQIGNSDEIIISDDGSSDSTLSIIESLNDNRVKIFTNEEFHGVNGNFENTLSRATGDYIFLSDQDDVWLPNKVEICLNYLKKYDCIVHDGYITDENLAIQSDNILNESKLNGFINNFLHNNYTGCCMVFRAKVLNRILPFPKTRYFFHDHWIGLICELKMKTAFVPDKLIYFRRHGDNNSTVTQKSNRSIFTKIFARLQLLLFLIRKKC